MTVKIFGNGNINIKPDGSEPMNYTWAFTLSLTLENMGFYNYGGFIDPNHRTGNIYINPANRKKYYIYRDSLDIFWKCKTLKLYAKELTRAELISLENWIFENTKGDYENE